MTHPFNQPDEALSIEDLFISVVTGKRRDLPNGYFIESKVITSGPQDELRFVANGSCSFVDLLLGKVIRSESENFQQDKIKFICNDPLDGVVIQRKGKDLAQLNSEDLLHLNAHNLIEQGILSLRQGEELKVSIPSYDLVLKLTRESENTRRLVLNKDAGGKNFLRIIIEQKVISENELHVDHIFKYRLQGSPKEFRFHIKTMRSPYYPDVFQHSRYFKGCLIDPVDYLPLFESYKKVATEMVQTGVSYGFFFFFRGPSEEECQRP